MAKRTITSSNSMYYSVIPIIYSSGSGGHFLASLLRRARMNDKTSIANFSEFGNCHKVKIDIGSAGGFDTSIEDVLSSVSSQFDRMQKNPGELYYAPMHTLDTQSIMDNFNQCIKIVYTREDIPEIARTYLVKWAIEGNNTHTIPENHWLYAMTNDLNDQLPYFTESLEFGNRMMHVTWTELLRSDPEILIEKLHRLTDIPIDNFDQLFISDWRAKTLLCLTKPV